MTMIINPYWYAGGSATDPFFSDVVLLMHMDGTNGSTSFIDVKGHTLTPNGNAQISTADYVFGGASGLFDNATGDWVDASASADFSFGTGDFTIEGWLNVADTGLHFAFGWGSDCGIYMSGNQLLLWNGSGNVVATSPILTTNTWYYFAVVVSAGIATMYVNGIFVSSAAWGINGTGTNFRVGGRTTGSGGWTGYMDDVRVTKGVARYSGPFSPPTAPFPDA